MARKSPAAGSKRKQAKTRRSGKKRSSKKTTFKPQGTDYLDERLTKALAHWMRVNIMAIASWRIISPSDYARETGEDINRVSYHVRKLVEYDVLELVHTEPVRGSVKHYYRGTRRAIFGGASWAKLPKSVQDGVAGAALQDFVKVAVHSIESGAFSAHDHSCLIWEPHRYDDLAFKAAAKLLERVRKQLADLAVEAAPRLADTGQEGLLIAVALGGFEMGEDEL
jgi:hypothetical protein